jgi:hypothetical protein
MEQFAHDEDDTVGSWYRDIGVVDSDFTGSTFRFNVLGHFPEHFRIQQQVPSHHCHFR